MSAVVDLAVRASVVLAAGLLARAWLRRRSPALRHLVLAVCVVAAPAAMPLGLMLPSWPVASPWRDARMTAVARPQSATAIGEAVAVETAAMPARDAWPGWRTLGAVAWGLGSAVAGLLLAIGYGRLARLTARARPMTDGPWIEALAAMRSACPGRRPVRLALTARGGFIATWGWRRPVVIVPEEALTWGADRIDAVLRHELAHVARHDWIVHVYADAVRVMLWWNPLAWHACRRLRQDSELACDDAVLAAGVAPHAYADQLVAIARAGWREHAPRAAMSMAHPSTLQKRIVAMLNPRLDRTTPTRRTALAAIAALLLAIVLPAAVLGGGQGPQALEGVIYDPTGAVLPGVAVTLTAGATHLESVTDPGGHFRFDAVAPGQYVLDTSLMGFKRLREPMTLKSNDDWNRAVTLQVGDLRESISVRQRRVAPQAATQAGPSPVRVGGNIRVPAKTLDKRPVYPQSMIDAGREGVVPIEATIDVDGHVSMVRVVSTQVHPDFAIAAVEAVRQWQYTPTLLNGRPVQVVMTVTVAFTLE
jgi:TonB family protein